MTNDQRPTTNDRLEPHVWVRASSFVVGRWPLVVRRFSLAAVVVLMAMALNLAAARAQDAVGPVIEELQVDLWPEYDDPRLLVIYAGRLAAPAEMPLRFPIPVSAQVHAVAQLNEADRLINVSWQSEDSGDLQVISFTPGTTRFQMEYYIDVIGPGPEKSFSLDINVGNQPVRALGIAVQQPLGASSLQGEPALSGPVAGFQGFSLFSRQIENVQSGQTIRQTVTYFKPNDTLSVDRMRPTDSVPEDTRSQPAAAPSGSGFSTNLTGRSATRFWLPILATAVVVVGLVLIGLGVWRARQESAEPVPSVPRRSQRARPARTAARSGGAAKFCYRCGAPFAAGDEFCAECGTPRRRM